MVLSPGTVAIEAFKGRLRLRWRVARKRYCLSLGLPATQRNRQQAIQKAQEIEADLAAQQFDPTLVKYRGEDYSHSDISLSLSLRQQWEQFTTHKAKTLSSRTLQKYSPIGKLLTDFFGEKPVYTLQLRDFEAFVPWLQERYYNRTIRERLVLLNACWRWSQAGNHNPWQSLLDQFPTSSPPSPQPFTPDEITAILTTFQQHSRYCHYAAYVEFLAATGVRTAEAIGLRWRHIRPDLSSIWIGETYSRGVIKVMGMGKDRTIILNEQVKSLLSTHPPDSSDPEELVFPSPTGLPINDVNFRNRAWVTILQQAEIPYRHPYTLRHTFVLNALQSGQSHIQVAKMTGLDLQTLRQMTANEQASSGKTPVDSP
jgi:integrase